MIIRLGFLGLKVYVGAAGVILLKDFDPNDFDSGDFST